MWRRVAAASPREAATLVNRELFGRVCTAAQLPSIERVCADWRPQLVVREPCEYASAVVAERAGIPHVQVAISLAAVEAGSLDLAAPVLEPHRAGIVEALRAAPYLTRFPASLDPSPFATTLRYRAAAAPARPLPDWWDGDARPLVYATLGSLAGTRGVGAAAYRLLAEALAELPARVLLTLGRDGDPAALPPLPAHVRVERWVEQADVLPHAAAVVCHGGSGTVFGALAAGVPLVVLPLFADQPVNARLVAAAGAGIAFADAATALPSPARVRAAIEAVLDDAAYAAGARRLAAELQATPALGDVLAALTR